jgi:hypothetical protein
MDLVNDLGNDLVLAMLVEKKHGEKIDSKEIVSLIGRIREVLEPISTKDHSYTAFAANVNEATNSH